MEYEKGTIDMNYKYERPPGCEPGVKGCTNCQYVDCIYNGYASSREISAQKKTVTAPTATVSTRRFAKYSTSHYSTFPRRVNSIFTQNNLESILV